MFSCLDLPIAFIEFINDILLVTAEIIEADLKTSEAITRLLSHRKFFPGLWCTRFQSIWYETIQYCSDGKTPIGKPDHKNLHKKQR